MLLPRLRVANRTTQVVPPGDTIREVRGGRLIAPPTLHAHDDEHRRARLVSHGLSVVLHALLLLALPCVPLGLVPEGEPDVALTLVERPLPPPRADAPPEAAGDADPAEVGGAEDGSLAGQEGETVAPPETAPEAPPVADVQVPSLPPLPPAPSPSPPAPVSEAVAPRHPASVPARTRVEWVHTEPGAAPDDAARIGARDGAGPDDATRAPPATASRNAESAGLVSAGDAEDDAAEDVGSARDSTTAAAARAAPGAPETPPTKDASRKSTEVPEIDAVTPTVAAASTPSAPAPASADGAEGREGVARDAVDDGLLPTEVPALHAVASLPSPAAPALTEEADDALEARTAAPARAAGSADADDAPEPDPRVSLRSEVDLPDPAPTTVRAGSRAGSAGGSGGETVGSSSVPARPGPRSAAAAQGTPLGAYLAEVERLVSTRWESADLPLLDRVMGRRGTVGLVFEVRRSGQVSGLRVEKPSRWPALDAAALATVPDRLPRLPAELGLRRYVHHLTLTWTPGPEP